MTPLSIGLSIAGICVVSLAAMAFFALRAPEGFEDDDGFHYGRPDEWGDQPYTEEN